MVSLIPLPRIHNDLAAIVSLVAPFLTKRYEGVNKYLHDPFGFFSLYSRHCSFQSRAPVETLRAKQV